MKLLEREGGAMLKAAEPAARAATVLGLVERAELKADDWQPLLSTLLRAAEPTARLEELSS